MKNITLVLFLFFVSSLVFSQTDKHAGISNSQETFTPVPNPQVDDVIKNLRVARLSGDVTSVNYWEKKLNDLTQPQIINPSPNTFRFIKGTNQNSGASEVMNLTRITDAVIIGNSISRERINGDIYAAVGFYGSPTLADTLKVYRSTNNGLSFGLLFMLSEGDLKITYNSIDIEAVSKGDSSYAFVSMSYTLAGNKSSAIVRTRQDGTQLGIIGVFGNATNKYTNCRITSDNSVFTSTPYIYMSVTLDSTAAGGRNLKSKLFRLQNVFTNAMTMVAGYQNNTTGQYGYYVAGSSPDSAKFESDVAYVDTEGDIDQLYTVTVVRGTSSFNGGTSLHFTRSTDLGVSAPGLFFITDPGNLKESPRMASTGFLNNSAMVVVRRLFGGGDWDPYYFYTSNVIAGTPVFTSDYVDATSDTTMGVSVAGKPRSNGSYLFAFNNRLGFNDSKIFIRPFTGGSIGGVVQANPTNIPGTSIYGYPDAGFRNVSSDSCLVIWGGSVGIGSYVTGGCSGASFTGIGSNNMNAEVYSLSQNYPNPFNPSTIINYSLPVQSNVVIKIFDVLGKEVAAIVNETQSAGIHSVEFNAMNLTSGVYYYRIEANNFADTKKMLLIK